MKTQIQTMSRKCQNRLRHIIRVLFWHFLDIVWICVFTVVYLMGAL